MKNLVPLPHTEAGYPLWLIVAVRSAMTRFTADPASNTEAIAVLEAIDKAISDAAWREYKEGKTNG